MSARKKNLNRKHSSDEGGLRLNSTLARVQICLCFIFSSSFSEFHPWVLKKKIQQISINPLHLIFMHAKEVETRSLLNAFCLTLIHVFQHEKIYSLSLVSSSLLEKNDEKQNSSLVKRSYNSLNSIVIKCTYLMIFLSSSFHQTKRVEGEKILWNSEIHIFHFN